MATITFRRERLTARLRSPDGAEEWERTVEVRFDPLLGTTSRVAEGVTLKTGDPAALEPLREPSPTCPFCPSRLEEVTPRIPPSLSSEPRIRVGETTLLPNLVPYSQYAAVAVFSPRHWLSLDDFTPRLLQDNLEATARYAGLVYAADPRATACAYNVNYLYPSGGSLPHPHAQVYLDPYPSTLMRLEQAAGSEYTRENGSCYWEDLIEEEAGRGERFVARVGAVTWLTPFAPLGFHEVRAVVSGRETLLELTNDDLAPLAFGISRVLAWYRDLGYNSFNVVLYSGALGGDPSSRVRLTMVTRSALVPYYRSDAMYLERLHWEAAVDRAPEDVARALRGLF